MTERRTCSALTNDGNPCRVDFGLAEDGMCWHHSPLLEDERRRASRNGALTTAKQRNRTRVVDPESSLPQPSDASDAKAWSAWVVLATATGRIDGDTSRALNSALNTFLRTLEKAEYEDAIDELRTQVQELQAGPPQLEVS